MVTAVTDNMLREIVIALPDKIFDSHSIIRHIVVQHERSGNPEGFPLRYRSARMLDSAQANRFSPPSSQP